LNDRNPPAGVVARVALQNHEGVIKSCHLAEHPKDGDDDPCSLGTKAVNVFEFQSFDHSHHSLRQALADGVVVEIQVPADMVTFELHPFAVGTPRVFTFKPTINPSGNSYIDIAIVNMPEHFQECPKEGTDFALLYDLAQGGAQIPLKDRLVPVRTSQCVGADEVQPACESDLVKTLFTSMAPSPDSRPICPMGVYQ
jgi:hypothetical protein